MLIETMLIKTMLIEGFLYTFFLLYLLDIITFTKVLSHHYADDA